MQKTLKLYPFKYIVPLPCSEVIKSSLSIVLASNPKSKLICITADYIYLTCVSKNLANFKSVPLASLGRAGIQHLCKIR